MMVATGGANCLEWHTRFGIIPENILLIFFRDEDRAFFGKFSIGLDVSSEATSNASIREIGINQAHAFDCAERVVYSYDIAPI
jgi:hypothetical protein